MPNHNSRKFWIWLAIGVVFITFLFMIHAILLPFVVGMMVAYFLDPAADWLQTKNFSRNSSAGLITATFFGVLTVTLLVISPMVYDQLEGLVTAVPRYIEMVKTEIHPYIENVVALVSSQPNHDTSQALNEASGSMFDVAKNFILKLFSSGIAVVNLVTLLLLTPVVAFYMLRDWDVLVAKVDNLLPRQSADVIREQLKKIDEIISAYLRGQVNVCVVLAVYYVVALALVQLNFFLIIGLIGGLLSFIPFIGAMSSFLAAILTAYMQFDGDITYLVIVSAIYGFGQVLEGNILVPKLVGDKIGVHPVWVIFGMLAGGTLFGFVGILLAVPLTAVFGVLARFAVEQYRDSELYKTEPPAKKSKASSKPKTA